METSRRARYSELLRQSDRLDDTERHLLRDAVEGAMRHEEIAAGLVRERVQVERRLERSKKDLGEALAKVAAAKEEIVVKLREAAANLDAISSDNSANVTTMNNLKDTADRIEEATAMLQDTR